MANLEDLLNERVVECDTLNPHDFIIKWLRLRQQQRHTCRNSMKQKKKTAVIAYFCCCLVGTIHASQPRQLLETCSKKNFKENVSITLLQIWTLHSICTRYLLLHETRSYKERSYIYTYIVNSLYKTVLYRNILRVNSILCTYIMRTNPWLKWSVLWLIERVICIDSNTFLTICERICTHSLA